MSIAIATCATAFALPTSGTEPQAISPEFSAFLQTGEHKAAILAAAQKASTLLHGLCPSYQFGLTGLVSLYRPFVMGSDGTPVAGIWKEPVSAAGCGETLQFNVLTMISPEKGVQVVPLVPGDGHADPVLMKDAMMNVYQYAHVRKPDCQQVQLVKTKFDGYEGEPIKDARDGPQSRKWQETWSIWACGDMMDMPIWFVPDATGTSFMTSVKP